MSEIAQKVQEEIDKERKNGAIIFQPSSIVPESFYRPVVEKVWLDESDLYKSPQNKWRIHYGGLLKLSNAAGIEWHASESVRTDNQNDKLYISFRAVGLIRKADGKLYPTAANYDLDFELIKEELRERYTQRSKDMKGSKDKKNEYINFCVNRDWMQKRKHKFALAESGAKARVIRAILGLQSQYADKNQILDRPFIMVRFVLDHQNKDIKPAMLTAAIGNMSAVYGGAPPRSISHETNGPVIEIPTSYDDLDSATVDFENCGDENQVQILTDLCIEKGYNLQNYLQSCGQSLIQMTQNKRVEFFNYLNSLVTNTNGVDTNENA